MPDEQQRNVNESDERSIEDQLEQCKREAEEYLNGWKRAKADYVNYKNETEKRRDELTGMALMASAGQFIPLLDNFKKAFAVLPDELRGSEWVKGVEHILNQMKEIMKGLGIEEFSHSVIGVSFDPSKHHAVGEERRDEYDDSVVTQEVSPGYTFRGNPIVPAKVIVNKKQESRIENQESGDSSEKKDLNS